MRLITNGKAGSVAPPQTTKQPVTPSHRLGDRIERLVKPIAKLLRLPCLDEQHKLRPNSPCARRRDRLNRMGRG
jgi:hypothetical protein